MPDIKIDVDLDVVHEGVARAREAADDFAARLDAARPRYVRVRDSSGHEITVRADLPPGHPRGVKDGMTVLDKPATAFGEPLRPKYRTPLGDPLPGSKVARKRSRKRAPDPVPADEPSTPEATTTDGHVADTPTED